MKCDLCGKTPLFGHNVSHSKRHTNRRWVPNIHPATINVDEWTDRTDEGILYVPKAGEYLYRVR